MSKIPHTLVWGAQNRILKREGGERMKKLVLLLTVIVLGTAVFAAAPKPSPVKMVVAQAPAPSAPGSMRVGVLTQAAPGGLGSIITVGNRLNSSMTGDVGLAIGQNAAGANTNIGVLLRLEYDMAKIGEVKTHAGGNLMFATSRDYANTSSLTLNIFAGIEYDLLRNLSLLADLTILEVTSSGGATSFGIGAGTANGTGLGAVAATLYCGGRLYL